MINKKQRAYNRIRRICEKNKIKLQDVIYSCPHDNVVERHDSLYCTVCDKCFGWYCPTSPDHLCDYEQEDGTYNNDICRYCGQPEERK